MVTLSLSLSLSLSSMMVSISCTKFVIERTRRVHTIDDNGAYTAFHVSRAPYIVDGRASTCYSGMMQFLVCGQGRFKYNIPLSFSQKKKLCK